MSSFVRVFKLLLPTETIMAQLTTATVKIIRDIVAQFLIGAPGRKGDIGRNSSSES